MDDRVPTTTDEFLAIHFPHLRGWRGWFHRLNEKMGWIKSQNGGSVNMRVEVRNEHPDCTEYNIREMSPRKDK